MTTWIKIKLDQLGSIVTGKTPSSKFPNHFGKKIPFVTPTDFSLYNKHIFNSGRHLSSEGALALKNKMLPENSIVVTCIGSDMGKVAMNKIPCITNQQINSIIPNQKIIEPDFLYYKLVNEYETLKMLATGGSTMPILNKGDFEKIEIEVPSDLSTQTRIASILSAFDDKIELNRQMNHTLEQMAQALFKKYFVDDIDPENLPEGWRFGELNEEIEIKHGYAFEGKHFSEMETNDVLLTPGNFKIGGGFNYNKFKYFKGDYPKEYILEVRDLIVTMTDLSLGGDTLGYSALVPKISNKRLLHNQRIGKVIFKRNPKLKFYLNWLMRTESYRSFVVGSATGTTVKHTSPTRIAEYKCVFPNDEKLLDFEKFVLPLHQLEISNNLEIESLSKLRDTLLPKLMNGEVSVEQLAATA